VIHDLPSSNPARQEAEEFRHVALLYAGGDEFVAKCAAFLLEGIESDEPALVVVDAHKIDLLRTELGDLVDRVWFADMAEVGQNPGAIISAWDDFVKGRFAEGQRVRGIGEPIYPERSADELVECHHHEALLNLAFADAPGFTLVCPYDTAALAPAEVEHAQHTHPLIWEDGAARASDVYSGDALAVAHFHDVLDPPPADAYETEFDVDALAAVRAFLSEIALDAGISPLRADDLLLAVNELATNSVRHGGGAGVLRVWTDRDHLVCEVSDSGRIAEPLSGRVRPPAGALNGYGLWMVNQVCDLVQVRVTDAGSVVRMRVQRR
jgi:anti-sigma regulatory factor (Ser/Thr protein kinase)